MEKGGGVFLPVFFFSFFFLLLFSPFLFYEFILGVLGGGVVIHYNYPSTYTAHTHNPQPTQHGTENLVRSLRSPRGNRPGSPSSGWPCESAQRELKDLHSVGVSTLRQGPPHNISDPSQQSRLCSGLSLDTRWLAGNRTYGISCILLYYAVTQ